MGVLDWLFDTAKFVPHGVCLLWRPDLVAIHVVSDALIALSYFAIPGAIWWFVRRRTDLEPSHRRIALLFVAFITACGLTHVASIVTLWAPYYGLQALLKLLTAAVSLVTAGALPLLVPKLLVIPSPAAVQGANDRLRAEVEAHQATLAELRQARERLEQRVADQDEDLRVINARFTTALHGSTVTVFEQDEELRYTWAFNSPLGDEAIIGKTEQDLIDGPTADVIQSLKREVLRTGQVGGAEVDIQLPGARSWMSLRVQPTALRDGRRGIIVVATNISVQKRQHEHLQLLMRELNHRSKNLLTIVQSITRQTAAGLNVPPAFQARLGERLQALASAHDVLVEGDWRGANLRTVIERQLSHQMQAAAHRIRLDGPVVDLPPEVAHYVALAVHELGANAVKYGALGDDKGWVEVKWSIEAAEGAGGDVLTLAWREFGGPAVTAPTARGFGRTILEMLVPRAMNGTAGLAFGVEGVAWTLTAPFDRPAG